MNEKFWDKSIKCNNNCFASADLNPVFEDLQECLKSENIDLSFEDIVKSFDIYLRFLGMGTVKDTDTSLNGINCICGPININIKDMKEMIDNGKFDKKMVGDVFNIFFNLIDEENKLDNRDIVIDNIDTIIMEFGEMINSIINKIFGMYNAIKTMNIFEDYNGLYSLTIGDKENTKGILFNVTSYDGKFDHDMLMISSNLFSNVAFDTCGILVDTMTKEDADMVRKVFAEDLKDKD